MHSVPNVRMRHSHKKEVRKIFGFRTRRSGKNNVGQILPQSNCKKCRAKIQR